MKVVPFVAESPAEALLQIQQQLGPEAVVLSVRPLPAQGFARLWQKTRAVEVVACIAEPGDLPGADAASHSVPFLQTSLASPLPVPPALYGATGRPHVFIGPPGTGKTTLLCKWLTLSVLNEQRTAKVWRLDGPTANTAEFLNLYCEMLGAPIERFWNPHAQIPAAGSPSNPHSNDTSSSESDLLLVDLPGVQASDTDALRSLKAQLASFADPRIHLVLNAAYESSILTQQFRAFAAFQPEDLSFSHLDEEKNQAKLLDFIVGTNCCLRFLSTGQKIPGDLVIAAAPRLACPQFAA
jgi:flagellar biosynthesis GTPase FlhF